SDAVTILYSAAASAGAACSNALAHASTPRARLIMVFPLPCWLKPYLQSPRASMAGLHPAGVGGWLAAVFSAVSAAGACVGCAAAEGASDSSCPGSVVVSAGEGASTCAS